MFNETEEIAFCRIIALAQQWSRCNFTRYNPSTLRRRVERRMIDVRCQSAAEYLFHLEHHPQEYPKLVAALTIKVSHFFRDPEVFSHIEGVILPRLIETTLTARRAEVRIWSAACATGEEAYSLAILVAESLPRQSSSPTGAVFARDSDCGQPLSGRDARAPRVSILATDIDCASLATAADGIYHEGVLRNLSEPLRHRYFSHPPSLPEKYWQVTPGLRSMVNFVSFDLTNLSRLSPPSGIFSEYDFILCRNMLIYCQHALKMDILRRFHTCLRPNGYLALGRSEALPEAYQDHFVPVDPRLKIYLKKEAF